MVDTGAERTLGNIALREALKQHSRSGRGFVAKLTTVYGATTEVEKGEIQSAPTISMGSLRMTDVAVVYGDFHIFKVWDMQNKPAMIRCPSRGTPTSIAPAGRVTRQRS